MKISIILAHPETTSFNHSIARIVTEQLEKNGHRVICHDLYGERFDPLLYDEEIPKGALLPVEIQQHCQEIAAADGIVIVHPNWWGQPPAILKGWVDRVIRPGVASDFLDDVNGEVVPNGLLKAQAALVFNTSNTAMERGQDIFGDPLERIWKDCIFDLCGVKHFHRRMFNIMVTSSSEQRAAWLNEVGELVDKTFPE